METTPNPPRFVLYCTIILTILAGLRYTYPGNDSSHFFHSSSSGEKANLLLPVGEGIWKISNVRSGSDCGNCDVINGPSGPVCPGSMDIFSAQITGICDNPQYTWSVTGNAAGFASNGSAVTVTAGNLCQQSYTVSVTITCEGCGTSPISCSVDVLVQDDTAPVITFCPPDITIECNTSTLPASTGMATATDQCDTSVTILTVDYPDTPPMSIPEMRFLYLPPGTNSGNCVSGSDCQAGIICFALEYTPGVTGTLTSYTTGFFVNCYNGNNPILSNTSCVMADNSEAIEDCGESGLILMNSSGNTGALQVMQNVPVILHQICFQLSSGGSILLDEDEATDLTTSVEMPGGGLYTETPSYTNFTVNYNQYCEQTCPYPSVIFRRFIATDDCGNQSSCIQQISIVDQTPPAITCPANVTVQCSSNTAPAVTGMATATDNCGEVVSITSVDSIQAGACPQAFTIFRMWTAEDNCGNSGTCAQIITVKDNAPPTLICPPDITIQCSTSIDTSVTGAAMATDNCSGIPEIIWSDITVNGSCPEAFLVNRLWKATDECGNFSLCLQVITVVDDMPPTIISCPADVTLECDASSLPADIGSASATDACDPNVQVLYFDYDDFPPAPSPELRFIYLPPGATSGSCVSGTDCESGTICFALEYTPGVSGTMTSYTTGFFVDCYNGNDPVISNTSCVMANNSGEIEDCAGSGIVLMNSSGNTGSMPVSKDVPVLIHQVCFQLGAGGSILLDEDQATDLTMSIELPGGGLITESPSFTNFIVDYNTYCVETCPYPASVYRKFVAIDDCENHSTCIQAITIQDLTAPLLTCPADITITCTSSTDPAATGMATATDNCGDVPTISYADVTMGGSCPQNFSIMRTWMALDNCGNSTTCLQSIVSDDNIPPAITCPPNLTLQCDADTSPMATGIASATDVCDMAPSISYADVSMSGSCPQQLVINRIWTASDVCGNSASCTQNILVHDVLSPAITCPPNITILCTASTLPANTGMATATDNCDPVPVITSSDVTAAGGCPAEYTILRTWQATDACGNSNTCLQVISRDDNMPPMITCPPNVTVSCIGQVPPINVNSVIATDDCSAVIVTYVSDNISGTLCQNHLTLTRVYRATDACGNSATCSQIITVNDQTPPSITCPAPLTVSCTSLVPAPDITSVIRSDNCGGNPTVTFVGDAISNQTCTNRYTLTRTYRATDACGNSATCTQTITVNDQTPPSITCPPPVAVSCTSMVPAPDPAGIIASDNCNGVPVVTFVSDITTNQTCANRYTLTRTYRATDECGNSTTCTQTITVNDQTPPMITCPPPVTVSCASEVPPADIASVLSSDNCGGSVIINFLGDVISNMTCDNRYMITRTYRATDACLNTAECTQIITVFDATPPVVICPSDVTVNCAEEIPVADPSSVIASDNCNGIPVVTFVNDVISNQNCVNQLTITRTYKATDECGNSATCSQTITVLGNIAPLINCPPDMTVSCAAMVPAPDPLTVTALGNCSGIPVITFVSDVTTNQTCLNRLTITRTYRATDECGNSATCSHLIVVDDETPPMITCPMSVTVSCAGMVPAPDIASVMASDNCNGEPIITFEGDVISNQSCANRYDIVRTYQAMDECGNFATCTQVITVNDQTPPTITCPADLTVSCSSQVPVPDPASLLVSDNCGEIPTVTFVSDVTTNQTCVNGYILVRTYRATDVCGNSATCVQAITVNDQTPPMVTCPPPVTVSCASEVPPADIASVLSSDNCGGSVTINYLGDVISNMTCDNRYMITRTYRATDACLNTAECTQIITVFDATPPVVICPSDVTVNCAEEIPVADPSSVIASDNCNGIPVVTFVNDVISNQNCVNQLTITRTYKATDECGNSATCSQTITVLGNIAPLINCPPDMTVSCAAMVPAPDPLTVTALGNCSGIPVITFVSDVTTNQTCVNRLTITRTYRATDECGNSATCSHLIVVDDETPPMITCPMSVTVSCAGMVPAPDIASVMASDNCNGEPIITFEGDVISNQSCANRYDIVRTYQAMDECGNFATCTQVITVNDQTPPTITCPADLTVSCSSQVPVPDPASLLVSDNCGEIPTVTFVSDVTTNQTCVNGYILVRTYRATDECGNSTTCTQAITVNDQTPPMVTCPPPVTVSCASEVPPADIASVLSSDNCGGSVTIDYLGDVISNMTCDNRYMITRTYRATDACLNTAECTQIITVFDATPPVVICPSDVTVNCAEEIPVADPSSVIASDNCNGTPVVTFVNDVVTSQNCVNQMIIQRTYQATDECGNSATCSQTITVLGNIAPLINCPPDMTVTCVAMVPAPDPLTVTAMGSCSGTPVITFVSDVTTNQTCVNRLTIIRTYRATDECGNSATCSHLIVVDDETPPMITCPMSVTVSCAGMVPAPDIASVMASDNCNGEPIITFEGDVISNQSCANRYDIVRTYRATDECGNSATCIQMITVNDQTPPSITCPSDVTVSCASEVAVPDPASVIASDNCGEIPTVIFVSDVTTNQTCANRYQVIRTYQASDVCNNSATCTQVITVDDHTPPSITCPPDVTVSCAGEVPTFNTAGVISQDNCGGNVTIAFLGDVVSNMTCNNRFTITRMYRATDACLNTAICTQTITVFDATPPAITCPPDFTVTCAEDIPVPDPASVTASDNCNGVPVVTFVDDVISNQNCANQLTLTRIYRATDECGNSATCSQMITVLGNILPDINCPSDLTVTCTALVPAPDPSTVTSESSCSGIPVVTFVSDVTTNQTCANRLTITRTYRATDVCGNSATCSHLIIVDDQTPPVITCPAPMTVSCAGMVPAPNPGSVLASDNCNGLPVVSFEGDLITNQTCTNRYLLIRTYRATDECGNSASCTQLITVNDQTPPVITCPPPVTVSCASFVPVPDPGSIVVNDNCGQIPTVSFVSDVTTSQTCANRFFITRTYRAMDDCGNSATCSQLITVKDNIPPTVICPPDLTVSCSGEVPAPDIAGVSAIDVCSPDITVSYGGDVIINQTCANRYTIMRTYRANDNCWNSASCTQIIYVNDQTPPVITCPPDITVACSGMIPIPDINSVVASDNCTGSVTVNFVGDATINQSCTNRYTVVRTYQAADQCGNSSTCSQLIYVDDQTPPSISCPSDLTVSCELEIPPVNTEEVITSDICEGDVSVTHLGDIVTNQTCANRYVLIRTYLAQDDCGNSVSCQQAITVYDNDPPQIECPDDITVDLESSTSPDVTGSASGSDNCGGIPQIDYSDVTVAGICALEYFIERTWRAMDECGNSSTCTQEISISGGCFLDLSLTKELAVGQSLVFQPGDDVHFTLRVSNDGNIPIGAVQLVDYIPIGFSLNDPNWTAGTDGSTGQSASILLSVGNGLLPSTGLLPSAFVDVNITLGTDVHLSGGSYTNIGEISAVYGLNGDDYSDRDIDSHPDTDDTNDLAGEDDHSPVEICAIIDPVITGDRIVCQNQTSTYHVASYNPDHFYNWDVGIGGFISASTDSTITVYWYAPVGSLITIVLEESSGESCIFSTIFDVTIGGGEPLACFDHINLSIDNDCGTQIFSGMILTGDLHGDDSYLVYVIDMTTGDTLPNATVDWTDVGKTFKVSVRSPCSGQSCWGLVTVEDKSPPIIECVCPAGETSERCRISCTVVDQLLNGVIPDNVRPKLVDDCGGATIELTDVNLTYADCSHGNAVISWLATDAFGNTATCVQEFDVQPLNISELAWPADYTGDCDDDASPDNTGWPQLDGINLSDIVASCNIWTQYTDQVVPICGHGRKIIRHWSITNMCNGQKANWVQTILLKDRVGPVLTCAPDMTVGTDVWSCYATVHLTKPAAYDACSAVSHYQLFASGGTILQTGDQFTIADLPVGTYQANWIVTDECYNSSTCTIQITVKDNVPPVVSCQSHTILSLTNDRSNGITLIPASAFDAGSFDNCSSVHFRVRRMDSCIDFNWTTGGACIDDIPGGTPPVDELDMGTTFGTCIPVACCDIGQPLMVQLEVTDESGNVNYCMVQAEVQDKLAPVVTAPPTILISCDYPLEVHAGTYTDATGNGDGTLDEDPLSDLFGNLYDAHRYTQQDRKHIIINDPGNIQYLQPHEWGLEGWASDNCEVDLSVVVTVIDDCTGASFPVDHPEGAVKLIQRRFLASDGVQSGSALQRIWVVNYHPYYIQDTTCYNEDPADGIIWPCDVLVTTCPQDITDTGEPIILDDGCSLIGMTHEDTRFDFAEGACFKILREWKIIDWCQFNVNTGYGLWTYTQTIKVADNEGAEFLDCPSGPEAFCVNDPGISLPANNQLFLGENNPNASSCSVHVNMHRTVREMCSTSVTYDVKLYLFNGPDFIQIKPETTVELDSNHIGDLYFDTQESGIPSIVLNGLPYNSPLCEDYHRVLWSVEDGCGNRTYCDYLFRLEDCKNPTPVCIDGLSTVNMLPSGEVTLPASGFNASSVDDCTPSNQLLFSFSGTSYEPTMTFTCDNVPAFGVPFDIEMWAADGGRDINCDGTIDWSERNKDFCTASLVITDTDNICNDNGLVLVGEIMTDQVQAVSDVMVHLNGPQGNMPPSMTHEDGKYTFAGVATGYDYDIRPERNDNPKNGVSTLDLVIIQKHLLGKEPFTKATQYIAADANNSGSVSAIDLIEIRKLILGLYDEFPNNQSWRFIRKEEADFPGPPWPITENISIQGLTPGSHYDLDFVGVKIGDVNSTAQAHLTQIMPRNARLLTDVKAAIKGDIRIGEMIECKFILPRTIAGFQWTLETKGLTYTGIRSTSIPIDDSHVGVLGDGVITMSWNGDPVTGDDQDDLSFILQFRVNEAGKLNEMLKMTSAVTPAEAYTVDGEIHDVKLDFDEDRAFTDFALYQNKPNPWDGQTLIEFDLPYDGVAKLTVYDVAGKVVKRLEAFYKAGHNSVMLTAHDIPTPGVLYYRLDSGVNSAVRKMMIFH